MGYDILMLIYLTYILLKYDNYIITNIQFSFYISYMLLTLLIGVSYLTIFNILLVIYCVVKSLSKNMIDADINFFIGNF